MLSYLYSFLFLFFYLFVFINPVKAAYEMSTNGWNYNYDPELEGWYYPNNENYGSITVSVQLPLGTNQRFFFSCGGPDGGNLGLVATLRRFGDYHFLRLSYTNSSFLSGHANEVYFEPGDIGEHSITLDCQNFNIKVDGQQDEIVRFNENGTEPFPREQVDWVGKEFLLLADLGFDDGTGNFAYDAPFITNITFGGNYDYGFMPPNKEPEVHAQGPYEVIMGNTVQVSASGSDPENGSLSYAWDLDNNGSFETSGQNVDFSSSGLSAGQYSIVVQVTDEGGLTANDSATVAVVTTQQATEEIGESVQDLIDSGTLTSGHGSALLSKLNNIIAKINGGQTNAAINQLQAFVAQVNDLINSGELTSAEGQSLIDKANTIISAL